LSTVRSGILLGALVVIWTSVMGYTGWYKEPDLQNLFWLVVPLEGLIVVWGLKQAAFRRGYWGTVGDGFLISAIGGIIIFAGSYILTTILFPQYFKDVESLARELMRAQGKSDAEISAAVEAAAPMQNSLMQALMGFIGTVVTGLAVSMTAAIFISRKD
jgi:hypothetical protein